MLYSHREYHLPRIYDESMIGLCDNRLEIIRNLEYIYTRKKYIIAAWIVSECY
jgi:hypothetical protein